MGQTLGQFAKRMRKRAEAYPNLANECAKAGTEAMLREMVVVTPVDESTALSNWQVNLNNPAADVLPAYTPGSKGSTAGASASQAINEGLQEIARKKPGQKIFLSNATPYIGDLDDGSSPQFSGGFIPRALIVFRLAVQERLRELLK